MKLLIDSGNTTIQWLTYANKNFSTPQFCPVSQIKSLETTWKNLPVPQSILISHVGEKSTQQYLTQISQSLWDESPHFATTLDKVSNFTNDYQPTEGLGVDRWLTALAAFTEHQNACCIIDCGTAITVDSITSSGQYQGGYILPSLKSHITSLNNSTQLNVTQDPKAKLELKQDIPNNTQDAITQGYIAAITGAINTFISKTNPQTIILTGGNAKQWSPLIENLHHIDPLLVFKGLLLSPQAEATQNADTSAQ